MPSSLALGHPDAYFCLVLLPTRADALRATVVSLLPPPPPTFPTPTALRVRVARRVVAFAVSVVVAVRGGRGESEGAVSNRLFARGRVGGWDVRRVDHATTI